MTGFKVEPGQNLDGTYRTIANGNISFKQHYYNGAYVAFQIYMGSNKVINMKAWTSKDIAGTEKIEEGYAEIAIDNGEKSRIKTKFLAPSGTKLQPKQEINNMLQLCQNYERCRNKVEKSNIAKRIAACVSSICNAGNKEEFAPVVLEAFSSVLNEELRQRLFTIARKVGQDWSEFDKRRLANAYMSQISADINGFSMGEPKVSTNIQAIYTLSICASMDQLSKLAKLHDSTRYLQACLYTHAKARSDIQWLQDEFEDDAKKSLRGLGSNIQFSSYAIGVALRKEGSTRDILSASAEGKIVKKLCEVVCSGKLSSEELTCCLLALGWICDQREPSSELPTDLIQEVYETIRDVDYSYSTLVAMKQDKAKTIALKMVNGSA